MDKHNGGYPGGLRVEDPWQDAAVAGLWALEQLDQAMPGPHPAPVGTEATPAEAVPAGRAAAYLEVQRSAAFRDVRERYRKFVFPAAAAFIGWYLLYVVAATAAPGLMARHLAGELNVALAAGLAQFATTFLLTWAYARHARLRRDRAALELRWTLATRTGQERLR